MTKLGDIPLVAEDRIELSPGVYETPVQPLHPSAL